MKLNLKTGELGRAKAELKKQEKDILFLQKELNKFYNSKGYKYILKPLEKVYLKIKKKK